MALLVVDIESSPSIIAHDQNFRTAEIFIAAFKSADYLLNYAEALLKAYPNISWEQFICNLEQKFKGETNSPVFTPLIEPIDDGENQDFVQGRS